jgi:hypothetical protein
MTGSWSLPSDTNLGVSSGLGFQYFVGHLPIHMVDATPVVAWRAWYARKEATHDKVVPPILGHGDFYVVI